jgi:hypothetical protein
MHETNYPEINCSNQSNSYLLTSLSSFWSLRSISKITILYHFLMQALNFFKNNIFVFWIEETLNSGKWMWRIASFLSVWSHLVCPFLHVIVISRVVVFVLSVIVILSSKKTVTAISSFWAVKSNIVLLAFLSRVN